MGGRHGAPLRLESVKHCDPAHATIYLEKLQELVRTSHWEELRRELRAADGALTPEQLAPAAVLALQAGLPALAADWAQQAGETQIQAAALLRSGDTAAALALLPGNDHRSRAMQARAQLLAGNAAQALELASQAHEAAFEAGDAPVLIAVIALLGELELRGALESGSRTGLFAALNVLAEGLKLSEILRDPADPHVLALIALTQQQIKEGPKAQATAAKALERSLAFSPAGVLALTVLGRHEEAQGQAEAGALADGWWTWAKA